MILDKVDDVLIPALIHVEHLISSDNLFLEDDDNSIVSLVKAQDYLDKIFPEDLEDSDELSDESSEKEVESKKEKVLEDADIKDDNSDDNQEEDKFFLSPV